MKKIRYVTTFALILAVFVVMLGAYTRLTDAGLGCPDWPGCYGKMVLPSETDANRAEAEAAYPDIPIESTKAWTEMAHRYAAGTLGLLIIGLASVARFGPKTARMPWFYSALLLLLLVFQAALGMWTVTLKLLPVVVMGHLLGGMTLAVLLFWYRLHLLNISLDVQSWRVRFFAWLGLGIVAIQIALGGWVSSNYAGLACIGFPTCNQHWLPTFDWLGAFNICSPIGVNYQGGALDLAARVTIQWTHRLFALITFVYVSILSITLLCKLNTPILKRAACLVVLLLVLQCTLGILNVVYMLPLSVAVLHNGVALLLLMSMVRLVYFVSWRHR